MGRRSNGFAWKRRPATAQNIQADKEVCTIRGADRKIMLDYPYRIAKKRIDIVKADDIAVMEPDKPQKRLIIISTIKRFYFPDYPKGSQN